MLSTFKIYFTLYFNDHQRLVQILEKFVLGDEWALSPFYAKQIPVTMLRKYFNNIFVTRNKCQGEPFDVNELPGFAINGNKFIKSWVAMGEVHRLSKHQKKQIMEPLKEHKSESTHCFVTAFYMKENDKIGQMFFDGFDCCLSSNFALFKGLVTNFFQQIGGDLLKTGKNHRVLQEQPRKEDVLDIFQGSRCYRNWKNFIDIGI
eukprot:Awhi_evm1s3967